MILSTTTTYALLLIPIWFILWIRVTSARSALNCSIGDAGDLTLLQKIRQHGNFIEWVPFALLLMVLAEAQGTDALWLHGAGALLLIGRLAHPFGLAVDNAGHPLRYVGNGTNILAILVLAIALIRLTFGFETRSPPGDTPMQYMILIYNDPALEPAYGTPEFETMMGGFFALNERMKADKVLLAGEGLQGVETATSLRLRGGKVETMDGPFAETREHLGGFYTIDVPDLDAALRYAAMVPSAAFGTIEVRPLMGYNPADQ